MDFLRNVFMITLLIFFVTSVAATENLVKPGCPHKCGNITIPYPFGIGKDCYPDKAFSIECEQNDRPFVIGQPVLDISIEGQLCILLGPSELSNSCGNSSSYGYSLRPFALSKTRNKLMDLGCGAIAVLNQPGMNQELTSCMTQCESTESTSKGNCPGPGCCEATIVRDSFEFSLSVLPITTNGSFYSSQNPKNASSNYSYAFLVKQEQFKFNMSDLWNFDCREHPVVLDWFGGQGKCAKAKNNTLTYACKSFNSSCFEPESGRGYRCKCSEGYMGNPYLIDGCKDINECNDPKLNECVISKTCRNIEGNYTVAVLGVTTVMEESKVHVARPYGKSSSSKVSRENVEAVSFSCFSIYYGVGSTIGLLVMLLGLSWVYWLFRQKKLKEHFFKLNGGVLLRQKLGELERSRKETKILSPKDLQKATNNYHESRILGQAGQGTVYKGILPDKRVVAIKKAKIGDRSQIAQFINEVILLSQINHKNVVKLLGCCLETEVPSLVYEFVTNGSLFDHMHSAIESFIIPWETRLRIAIETAGALMYLHSSASIPIIHRDINSANILLDDRFRAKVSDFGASRLLPADKEQLTTLVQGTLGYLDPEYFETSHLNEKSDVYSFGVVLLELVTGEKALLPRRGVGRKDLVTHVAFAIQENHFIEVLDQRILNVNNFEQLRGVAYLGMRCVTFKGEERPTMEEVMTRLKRLRDGENISGLEGQDHELITINNEIILEYEDSE